MKWKYKIDLKEDNAIAEIEKKLNIMFPKELYKYIYDGNAATPEKNKVIIGDVERVLGTMFSFNRNDEADSVFGVMDKVCNNNIPFAMDPFGNLFLYNVVDKFVLFFDHENMKYDNSEMSINVFFDSLY
ncbi:MAG: SMI1/KNR4 family protein [Oscillospiraceae bacterium]|nr:SMI1/KNR4 family protein [Oscillospiraceae bacterium]